tara:strand:- start:960 stop:1670 length:711 start_codon:yes stop_codon:yes gene_type:complete
MNNIGILGYGEVGKAVCSLYKETPKIKDLADDVDLNNLDILHICIPFSDTFEKTIIETLQKNKPKYCIIHSTVAPYTTQNINNKTDNVFKVCHSPVRGIHPNLLQGLLTFESYFGCDFNVDQLQKHLVSLGLKIKKVSSVTSEISKLLDTTYYGLCIAWHGEVKKICDQLDISFEEVSTNYNKSYNEGYKKLGKENVVRPVLYAPEKIGGHCVVPNTEILKNHFKSLAFDLILSYK